MSTWKPISTAPMTKAEEFAQYMATAAEAYMEAIEQLDLARDDVEQEELSTEDLAIFEMDAAEARRRLTGTINEFRKRMPR